MLKLIDSTSLRALLVCALGWLLTFAIIYAVVPCFWKEWAQLSGAKACEVESLPLALYTSVATMFSLGYSDVYPIGGLKLFAAIQVVGGVVIAGLAIAAIVALPANHTRLAIRACEGHWVACVDLPNGRRFYSFESMFSDGRSLQQNGRNYDPNGNMHNTQYSGTLITNLFPTIMSIYENDHHSTDYTSGVFMFEMKLSPNGKCRAYSGSTLDRQYGSRDNISGKRIEDVDFIRKYEAQTATEADFARIVRELFRDFPPPRTSNLPVSPIDKPQ